MFLLESFCFFCHMNPHCCIHFTRAKLIVIWLVPGWLLKQPKSCPRREALGLSTSGVAHNWDECQLLSRVQKDPKKINPDSRRVSPSQRDRLLEYIWHVCNNLDFALLATRYIFPWIECSELTRKAFKCPCPRETLPMCCHMGPQFSLQYVFHPGQEDHHIACIRLTAEAT